jgi:hypothetical protein
MGKMKYILKHADGRQLTLDSGTVNEDTSLSLFIFNNTEVGKLFFTDLAHMVENFAGPYSPYKPTKGQVWYDNKNKLLKFYNGTVWKEFNPVIPNVTQYVTSGDTMAGILKLPELTTTSNYKLAATRTYVDTKQFKFSSENNRNISYVKHDNNYTIMHGIIYPELGSFVASVSFPVTMANTDYTILLSMNSTGNTSMATFYNSYAKTINGFKIIANDTFDAMGFIVLGYTS